MRDCRKGESVEVNYQPWSINDWLHLRCVRLICRMLLDFTWKFQVVLFCRHRTKKESDHHWREVPFCHRCEHPWLLNENGHLECEGHHLLLLESMFCEHVSKDGKICFGNFKVEIKNDIIFLRCTLDDSVCVYLVRQHTFTIRTLFCRITTMRECGYGIWCSGSPELQHNWSDILRICCETTREPSCLAQSIPAKHQDTHAQF